METDDATILRRRGDLGDLWAQTLAGAATAGGLFSDTGDAPACAGPDRPMRIGSYRVVRRLGSGGMGCVYLAEQDAPVRRRVAIKLSRPGLADLDSARLRARFDLERQALADLDHPHVAKLLDAGEHDALGGEGGEGGWPYFVLEYVPGEPITAFCDARRLGVEARVRLVVQVCRALQHAHFRGVLHRDLKPGNVLVADGDGEGGPQPKLIDFGIAAVLDGGGRGGDGTLTLPGTPIGTPLYAAPEQLGIGPGRPDVRGDVYSMGVVLHELLCGRLPFADAGADDSSWWAVGRLMRDAMRDGTPPPPPSRRADDNAAAARGLPSAAALARRLRGELDWVTAKALALSPDDRYRSAAALADDLEAALDGRPIRAAGPSRLRRARRFVARNRTVATAAAVVALALTLGGAATAWQAVRATAGERAAVAAAALAEERRAESAAVADWSLALISATDPYAAAGVADTEDLLDAGRSLLAGSRGMSPEARRQIHATLGDAYAVRLLPRRAAAAYRDALALAGEDEATAELRLDLRRRLIAARLDALETAEAEADAARAVAEADRLLPPGHPLAVRLRALWAIALAFEHDRLHAYNVVRSLREAEAALADARRFEGHRLALFEALEALGVTHARAFSLATAEDLFSEALSVATAAPGEVSDFARGRALARRAAVRRDTRDYAGSLADARAHLDRAAASLPEDHPTVLSARLDVAQTLLAAGRAAQATGEMRLILDRAVAVYPATHLTVHRTATALSTHLWSAGDEAAALAVWDAPLAAAERRDWDGALACDLYQRAGDWLSWRRRDGGWAHEADPAVRDRQGGWFAAAARHARRSRRIERDRLTYALRASAWNPPAGVEGDAALRRRAGILRELMATVGDRDTAEGTNDLTLLQLGYDDLAPWTGLDADERATLMRRSLLVDAGADAHDPSRPLPDPDDRPLRVRGWPARVYAAQMAARGGEADLDEGDRALRHMVASSADAFGRDSLFVAGDFARYCDWRRDAGRPLSSEEAGALAARHLDLGGLTARAAGPTNPAWTSDHVADAARVLSWAGRHADAAAAARHAWRHAVDRGEEPATVEARRRACEALAQFAEEVP